MKTASFSVGLITGAVVGAVAGMIIDPIKDNTSKKLRSSGSGVFKSIGSVIDGIMASK
jgi:gas vesicle protein